MILLLNSRGLGSPSELAYAESGATPQAQPEAQYNYRQGSVEPSPWMKAFLKVAGEVPNRTARRALKIVLEHPQSFRFQLLITEIKRLDLRDVEFKVHEYRVDREYFYPASAIKTYASLGALMYYTELKKSHRWLTTNAALSDQVQSCSKPDSTNLRGGHVTLEHEIRKTQLVSKNNAFNRVFNVLGSHELHRRLAPHFPSVRVFHRLSTQETEAERRHVPALHLCKSSYKGEIKKSSHYLRKPMLTVGDLESTLSAHQIPYTGFADHEESFLIGSSYRDPHTRKIVDHPMDFSRKNRSSFYDFQRLTLAIYRPQLPDPIWTQNPLGRSVFDAQKVRRVWLDELRHAMAIYPRHSQNPVYAQPNSETRFKPLIRGIRMNRKRGQPSIDESSLYYLNKAGKAFGFHMDNALIAVGPQYGEIQKNGRPAPKIRNRALLITVGVYANKNQRLNDNVYEYQKITVPLLNAIGYAVGRYFLKR